MKKHPEASWRILNSVKEFTELADFVLEHHEKWDGSGYPKGLTRTSISLHARIVGACDVFDGACVGCEGTGNARLTPDEALEFLLVEESSRFDEVIVRVLREAIEDDREIGALISVCA